MRRLLLVGLLLALLVPFAGCQQGVQLPIVPGPVLPPPVDPVVPVDPDPDPDPTARPDFPREALDVLTVGMTAEQVAEAIGSAPVVIPQGEGPPTVRWEVTTDGVFHILYVVFDDAGLLRDKGLAEVATVPDAP